MDWLGKLDPNVISVLLTAIGALVTWTYHQVKGDKQESFTDAITGIGKQAIHELLTDPGVSSAMSTDALQKKAEAIMMGIAAKLGIPSNAMTTAIITATAAHVVGDVLNELRAADALPAQVAALSDQIAAMPASLAAAEARGYAAGKAFADQMVEKVPPDPLPTATALPPK